MRAAAALAGLALLAALAGGCTKKGPGGVDLQALDDAIGNGIGDPSTCVLISRAGEARPIYRYNKRLICDRSWPSCDKNGGLRTVNDLLAATAKDNQPRMQSCFTNTDGSRGVGWASGVIEGKPFVYAAVMEGDRALPGRVMADRLAAAFKKVGL